MRVARLTVASAHHLLEPSEPIDARRPVDRALFADTATVLSSAAMYAVPVSCSYTSYKYAVHHVVYGV